MHLCILGMKYFKKRKERTRWRRRYTLRLLTQPELTENRTARKSDTKEIKNKHSSRPVGGAEMGSWGGEDCVAVADQDWRSVGGTEQAV